MRFRSSPSIRRLFPLGDLPRQCLAAYSIAPLTLAALAYATFLYRRMRKAGAQNTWLLMASSLALGLLLVVIDSAWLVWDGGTSPISDGCLYDALPSLLILLITGNTSALSMSLPDSSRCCCSRWLSR